MLRLGAGMLAGLCVLGADPMDGLTSELLKLGAVGSIALYLLYKDRERAEKSDARWEQTNEKLFDYLERNTKAHGDTGEAVREVTRQLSQRPCIRKKESGNDDSR